KIGDRVVKARTAIVEGQQRRVGVLAYTAHRVDCPNRAAHLTDGIEVPLEVLAAELIDVGAFPRESAGSEVSVLHHIVIHDRESAHRSTIRQENPRCALDWTERAFLRPAHSVRLP